MLPIGSLEHLLRAVGEQAVRVLRVLDPPGGADRARRNAAQAAAAASAARREREAVSSWLAQRDSGLTQEQQERIRNLHAGAGSAQ